MNRWGHIGAALGTYAPVAFVATALGLDDLALVGALGAAGLAMLPDIDLRLPLVSHRGATHTVWFAMAVAAGGGAVGWSAGAQTGPVAGAGLAAFGAAVAGLAVASHVAADSLTPMGVRPLWPLSDRRITYHVTRSANPVSNWLGLVAGTGLAVVAFALGQQVATLGLLGP